MVFIILNKIKCVLKITEVMDHLRKRACSSDPECVGVKDWKDGWGYKKVKAIAEATPYKHSKYHQVGLKNR